MKAVIIAGGLGTRMGDMTKETPKPMLPVSGKPLLEHQIDLLKRYGIKEIILCLGYLSETIIEHFKEGREYNVKIEYSIEDKPLGNAGCISLVKDRLEEDFLLINGDVMLDIDLKRLMEYHKQKKSDATLVIHPNDHPYDSDLLEIDHKDKVTAVYPRPRPAGGYYRNLVNSGVFIFSKKVFEYIPDNKKTDFVKDVFPKMLEKNEGVYGYDTPEYIKDMGTPKRLKQVSTDYKTGKIQSHNLENKRPAIFIDRDGVINIHKDLVYKTEDLELIPGSAKAISMINKSEHLAIVITNQPVIARGLCDFNELDKIHKKLETILGEEGAYLDRLYYCPHHPDKGFEEEVPEFKIDCECRKPKIGLIEQATREFNIDINKSMIIGDSTRDIACGKNAGIKTIGVLTGNAVKDDAYPDKPDQIYENLFEAITEIL